MRKVDPLDPMYMKGYNDGKLAAVKGFARRFKKLQQTKGIGDKTIQKMVEVMELPIEGEGDK
ncbi:hypothetical protein [Desertibacillus haloalkaliphilus]|uniref:hypothetical protein n=1 Tax=Desertibacillus haloalkaliphilus TaxID=1328930 RepID=UPI001C2685DC|nr:hypothetical protein [Desertibacillus haloalkaliphilus]MBU8908537.1 hypothetical protein [Desertibacillus haloalkaliphilus]